MAEMRNVEFLMLSFEFAACLNDEHTAWVDQKRRSLAALKSRLVLMMKFDFC